ncbi:hypothetical protein ACJX0J_033686, partial [Zea mays]
GSVEEYIQDFEDACYATLRIAQDLPQIYYRRLNGLGQIRLWVLDSGAYDAILDFDWLRGLVVQMKGDEVGHKEVLEVTAMQVEKWLRGNESGYFVTGAKEGWELEIIDELAGTQVMPFGFVMYIYGGVFDDCQTTYTAALI